MADPGLREGLSSRPRARLADAEGLIESLGRLMDWTASVRSDGRVPTLLCTVTEPQGFAQFADRIGRFECGKVVIAPPKGNPTEAQV